MKTHNDVTRNQKTVSVYGMKLQTYCTMPHPKRPKETLVVGMMEANPANCLAWLERNVNNRTANFPHLVSLVQSIRSNRWIGEATLQTISWEGKGTDGQHRAGAFVLHAGDEDQRQRALELLKLEPNAKQLEKVPALNDSPESFPFVPVAFGVDPHAFVVQDQDQRKRTGADMIAHDAEWANWLSGAGIDPKEAQQTLRAIHLRVNPGKRYNSKEDDPPRYGSLAKGGNIPAQRYKEVFLPSYGNEFTNAIYGIEMNIPEDDEDRSWEHCPWPRYMVYAAVTLAFMGEDEQTFAKVCHRAADLTSGKTNGIVSVVRSLKRKNNPNKRKAGWYMSALVYYLTGNGDTLRTLGQLDKALTGVDIASGKETKEPRDPEQQPLFRFNGPDSNTAQ